MCVVCGQVAVTQVHKGEGALSVCVYACVLCVGVGVGVGVGGVGELQSRKLHTKVKKHCLCV